MSQINLTGKSEKELKLENLYRERMKLFNGLTNSIRITRSDIRRQELVDIYRKRVYIIDNNIRRLNTILHQHNAQT